MYDENFTTKNAQVEALKTKISKRLLKMGYAEKKVNTMIEQEFDYVNRVYDGDELTVSKFVDLISSVYCFCQGK